MFNMKGLIVKVLKDGRIIFVEKDEIKPDGNGSLVFGVKMKEGAKMDGGKSE